MLERTIFDFQSQVGLTKHMGGLAATKALIRLCQIEPGQEVLEVGCGVGQTSVLLAVRYGCRVVGVDLSPGMLEFARERARQQAVSDRTEFRLGDIVDLPFEDDRFDVVFGESVTVFAPDHLGAIREYARVLRPGGVVGLNETAWMEALPPPEIVAWISRDGGGGARTHAVEGWVALLETAGLSVEAARAYPLEPRREARGLLRRYGLGGMLGVTARALRLYLRDPAYRSFVRDSRAAGVLPENLSDYLGYGLFVARKPEQGLRGLDDI